MDQIPPAFLPPRRKRSYGSRLFASQTSVSAERSKNEVEGLLKRYGADQLMSGWDNHTNREIVQFRCHERYIRFVLVMPLKDEERFKFKKTRGGYQRERKAGAIEKLHEQEIRRRWRALLLVVKAKLEAVASEISSFESEFMAHIVMPDGRTVAEHALPMIAVAYKTGKIGSLLALPAPSEIEE